MSETAAAFADVNGPELSSPVVNILKNMEVNGLQMSKVERARNRMFGNFQQADRRRIGLECIQRVLLGEAPLVLQDARLRVSVAVRPVVSRHGD